MPMVNYNKVPCAPWQGVHSIQCPHDFEHNVTGERLLPNNVAVRRCVPTAKWVVRCHYCRRPVLILVHNKSINNISTTAI